MHNDFKPRGIVKWHAFAAVYDPFDFSNKVNQGLFLQEQAQLSEDQISKINDDLISANETKQEVVIFYFHNGKFLSVTGKIMQIDPIEKTFKVNQQQLLMSQLVEIVINDD